MRGKHEDYILQRVVEVAKYIITNKTTVRATAKVFGVSKSTIHKDISERLPKLNQSLYKGVMEVIEVNKDERTIRGGIATKKLYERLIE